MHLLYQMADPNFGRPGRFALLLGVDIFVGAFLSGRRVGPPGSPFAIQTEFGWVLAGRTNSLTPVAHVATHHASLFSGDDQLLRQFWETEESSGGGRAYTRLWSSHAVVQHFKENHFCTDGGKFAVPLPQKLDKRALGESRSQAVRRFLILERSLFSRGQLEQFNAVMQEWAMSQ